jgi:ElaB/YqjD/DUF883 family membrane-anchored ribosome-binding protein
MATIGSLTDRDLAGTITDTAHSVGDKVRDRIDSAGNRLGDLTSKAQERVIDARDRVQHVAGDLQKNSRTMVKENPILAVAIGVGVGFILGRVLFR